jgi:hypothetical protein
VPRPRRGRGALLAAVAALALVVLAVLLLIGSRGHHRRSRPAATAPPATRSASTSITTTGATAHAPPTRPVLGVNVNRLFNDRTYAPAAIDAQLAALRATGVTAARSDTLWEITEPSPPVGGVHRYDWSFDDAIAGALASNGIQWLPIIDYSATWTQSLASTDHSAPKSGGDFAAYAGAVAARYGAHGSFWRAHPSLSPIPVDTYEIWNEPDNPTFWRPAPDARRYGELYLSARAAIAAIDPGARVIVGGLTNPHGFLPALIRSHPGLRGHIDGVAIHPYGFPLDGVLARIRGARRTLRTLGLGAVPLYVTEFGWTTHPEGALDFLPASARPSAIEQTMGDLGHLDCGVVAALLYTWVTPERDPADKEDWFGIHPPDGGSSPDTVAFARGLARASEPGARINLCGSA